MESNTSDAPPPPPPGLPCWVDLASSDVVAAAAFYRAVLGWTYLVGGEEMGHYHVAFAQSDNPSAGLGQLPPGTDAPRSWTVFFASDDVDADFARAKGAGATGLSDAPHDVPNQGRMALATDPGGATFGLWQATGHTGFGAVGAMGTMVWCEVNTPDAEQASAFYCSLMGATAEPMDGLETPYFTLEKGGRHVSGVLQMNEQWAGVPPHWMVYFAVDDIQAGASRVTENGGTLCHGPFDSPYGRIAVVTDPHGVVFSLIELGDDA